MLPATEKIQVLNPSPCEIRVVFPPLVSARGIDDYYRNLLHLLRLQPGSSQLVVDFRPVKKVNLKATLTATEWLPKTKKYVERVGAFGLKHWMHSILKAVLKISQRDDIKVFESQDQAEAWALGTTH